MASSDAVVFSLRRVPVRIPSSHADVPSERLFTLVMQSHNGPCPLLAIFNAFLLLRRFSLPDDWVAISSDSMCTMLRDYVYRNAHELSSSAVPSVGEAGVGFVVGEAMAFLPSLLTGLDLNVRFNDVEGFEYTPALSVFDCAAVRCFHTWIAPLRDPVRDMDYNACTTLLTQPEPTSESAPLTAAVKEWLEFTGQCTQEGVRDLNQRLKEREVGVLFRCNHFSTVFKFNGRVYTLCSDEAWAGEVVLWEELQPGAGGGFFDGYFNPVLAAASPRTPGGASRPVDVSTLSPDAQLQLALKLSQEGFDAPVAPVSTSAPTVYTGHVVAAPGIHARVESTSTRAGAAAAAASAAAARVASTPSLAPVAYTTAVAEPAARPVAGRNDRHAAAASTLRGAAMARYRSDLLSRGYDKHVLDGMSDEDVYAAVKSMGMATSPSAGGGSGGWTHRAQPGPRPVAPPAIAPAGKQDGLCVIQ